MESVYPQNDKIGLVEVPEIKTFFAAQPWSTDLLQIFVKFTLPISHWISVRLSKKVKILLFIFLPLVYSKSPRGNKKL